MKTIVLNNVVLTGTGGGGSRLVTVPAVTPGVGPASGDSSLSTETHPGTASVNGGALAPKAGDPSLKTAQ
jgi:hypothetical protein